MGAYDVSSYAAAQNVGDQVVTLVMVPMQPAVAVVVLIGLALLFALLKTIPDEAPRRRRKIWK